MSHLKDIEYYGEEVKDLLGTATFSDKLTEISAEKNDDIILRTFRSRIYGWTDADAETPAVNVMGLREEPISDEGAYRWVWYRYAIEGYVDGADPSILEKMTNRYAKAVKEVLKAKYGDSIGFVEGVIYSPVLKFEDVLYKTFSLEYKIRVMITNN